MSNISTIYDELLALVPTILTDHEQLNNPYFIDDETDIKFEKGWTLGFGPGQNTNREVGARFSWNRTFVLSISRRVFAHFRDYDQRITDEKLLLEDQKQLINGLEPYTSTAIANIRFVGDNGLEFLPGEGGSRFGFLLIHNNVSVEYFECFT